jgi:hypothetical protein
VPNVPPRRGRSRSRGIIRISEWHDLLIPTESIEVPCPPGMHRATYQRLANEYNRLLKELAVLPRRTLWPRIRKAYEHQFLNRIVRIRRRLRLPTPEPPVRRWYRTGEAALFLGVSTKSVLRWTASGFLRCERAGYWAHRYYAVEELVRVQRKLKT